jgi:hypothetical protein
MSAQPYDYDRRREDAPEVSEFDYFAEDDSVATDQFGRVYCRPVLHYQPGVWGSVIGTGKFANEGDDE